MVKEGSFTRHSFYQKRGLCSPPIWWVVEVGSKKAHITRKISGLRGCEYTIPKKIEKQQNTENAKSSVTFLACVANKAWDSIDFYGRGYVKPFSILTFQVFAWRADFEILCLTIFSTPGGCPALLLNICKLQTMSHILLIFLLLINHCFIQHDLYFDLDSFTPLSRTCSPSLLLTSSPLSYLASLCVGER